jgi:protein-disulfide isomerase
MKIFEKEAHLHPWRVLLGVVLVAVLYGVGSFGWQMYHYYVAIKTGKSNPILEQTLQASISRMQANAHVTEEDLAQLASPKAPSVGPTNALLTVVEFVDFDCVFSQASFAAVREALETYKNRVRFIIRDFPVDELHERASIEAMAARCAQAQGKYWAFHDKLFMNPSKHTDTDIMQFAKESGADEQKFADCLNNKTTLSLVEQDQRDGLRAGVEGTPAFFFNGMKVQGGLDTKTLNFLIDQFLKAATSTKTK